MGFPSLENGSQNGSIVLNSDVLVTDRVKVLEHRTIYWFETEQDRRGQFLYFIWAVYFCNC